MLEDNAGNARQGASDSHMERAATGADGEKIFFVSRTLHGRRVSRFCVKWETVFDVNPPCACKDACSREDV